MEKVKRFVLIILMALVTDAQAQVIVAPTILYMSDRDRFGTFIVMNRSTTPQEISIYFKFGYPASDSLGNLFMQYNDSAAAEKYSCANWVRGFPKQFIVNPGQQQIVRLTVAPPPNLPDGMYWTRLVTRSSPQQRTIDTIRAGVTANITFVLEQVTTVIYEKGGLNTSVTLSDIRIQQDTSNVRILFKLNRGGNAAFLGEANLKILDAAGNDVYSDRQLIAAYFDMMLKFDVPLSKLVRGAKYTAELDIDSERTDVPPENAVRIDPIHKVTRFTVK
jgi:hypothetical protein